MLFRSLSKAEGDSSVQADRRKACALLQAYVTQCPMESHALNADMAYISQNAARLLRFLVEIATRRGWTTIAKCALQWAIAVDRRQAPTTHPIAQICHAAGKGRVGGYRLPPTVLQKLNARWVAKPGEVSVEFFVQNGPAEIAATLRENAHIAGVLKRAAIHVQIGRAHV